jgi:hypothetical protein
MSPVIAPLVRRAILDLMADVGGEQNHSVLTLLLNDLGHRVAERDVRAELLWLADAKLIVIEELGALHHGADFDRRPRRGRWPLSCRWRFAP